MASGTMNVWRRLSLRQRRALLPAAVVVGVFALLTLAWHRDEQKVRTFTCESNLRLMYVIYQHVPYELWSLPPEKAISYSFCDGCRQWRATEQEREYLRQHGVGQPEDFGWSLTGLIYCYEDPEYAEKAAAIANMTVYTASTDIPPSSYVWLPADRPEILAACPYHHLAVLAETGEIIPWHPAHD